MSRALCVLGMMRTGTSAVAGVLDRLGVHFGPERRLLEPNVANPAGFWEHKEIIALNDELLARAGGTWFAPPDPAPGWHESADLDDLRERATKLVETELATADVWAWKDPRTCLTLPFWQALIPTLAAVVCVRSPVASGQSFATMGWAAVDRLDCPYEAGLDLWLRYTAAALEHTRGRRRLLVFYEELLEDPLGHAERLASFAGLSDALTPETGEAIESFLRAPPPGAVRETPANARSVHAALALYETLRCNFRG